MRLLLGKSLATRLFILSGLSLVVMLLATGFLLTSLYFRAVERAFDSVIELNMSTLIAQIAESGDPNSEDVGLVDSRYDEALSGWYWIVRDADNVVKNTSPSFFSTDIPELEVSYSETNERRGNIVDADGVSLRVLDRRFELPGEKRVSVMVTGNFDQLLVQVAEFRSQALIVLGVIAILLAIMITLIMRFGLRPINKIQRAIEDVRAGEAEKVTGTYPSELEPLAEEMNNLIESNAKIVERARSQVGNLAHALKTPLAVIQNEVQNAKEEREASRISIKGKVLEQTKIMRDQVTYYLERARLAARSSVIGKSTPADAYLERLVRAMRLIHKDKGVQVHAEIDEGLIFRGESQDFDDVVGNLLDNACKWCDANVWVSARRVLYDRQNKLIIIIEDDGPGIEEKQLQEALARGQRLDEKKAGTGLGLDIVSELVELYSGEITLSKRPQGGLRVEVILPAIVNK